MVKNPIWKSAFKNNKLFCKFTVKTVDAQGLYSSR